MQLSRRGFLGIAAGSLVVAACGGDDGGAEDDAEVDVGDVAEVLRYGDAPQQIVELTRPAGDTVARPTVVLVHGGFWSAAYDLTQLYPLVPSLLAEGWAVANIEYRGVGAPGGGWPGTFEDVAAAVDALADAAGVDPDRIVAIGHSAGGHLATWLAARPGLPADGPGADPAVTIRGVVAQAAVLDLAAAADQDLGAGATQALLGGAPADVPDRYALASPVARVPIGVPVELVHSASDVHVPIDQSERYEAAATAAGDEVTLTTVTGDHFAVIDPSDDAWATCVAAARRLLS